MKLGIMQPYFFPYLGYFDLIASVDEWIVFDTVQYIRHGWINRNRILHPNEGWQYILAPLQQHGRDILIKDVLIDDSQNWRAKIIAQLKHYQKNAPYYRETMILIESCLGESCTWISRLNGTSLEKVCTYLGIGFSYRYFSEMALNLEKIEQPGDWALEISAALGAKMYINPPGGAGLFDPEKFSQRGIELVIQSFDNMTYPCKPYTFVPALSVIDVLMWNSGGAIRSYLDLE